MNAATRDLARRVLDAADALAASEGAAAGEGALDELARAALAWGARKKKPGRAPRQIDPAATSELLARLREGLGREPRIVEVAAALEVAPGAARRAMKAAGWSYVRKVPKRERRGPSDEAIIAAWRAIEETWRPMDVPIPQVAKAAGSTYKQAFRAIKRAQAAGLLERPDQPKSGPPDPRGADDFG